MGIKLPFHRESRHLKSKEYDYRHHFVKNEKCCNCKYIMRYTPTKSKQVRYFCCHLDRQVASMNVCNAFDKKKIDLTNIPSRQAQSRQEIYKNACKVQEQNREKLKLNNDIDSSINHKCICIKEFSYNAGSKRCNVVIKVGTKLYFRITKSAIPKRLIFENRKLSDGHKLYFLAARRLDEFNKYFKVVE